MMVTAVSLLSCSKSDIPSLYTDTYVIVNESSYTVYFSFYCSSDVRGSGTLDAAEDAVDGSNTMTYTRDTYYGLSNKHSFTVPNKAELQIESRSGSDKTYGRQDYTYSWDSDSEESDANPCVADNWKQETKQTQKGSRTGKKDDAYSSTYTLTLTDAAVMALTGDAANDNSDEAGEEEDTGDDEDKDDCEEEVETWSEYCTCDYTYTKYFYYFSTLIESGGLPVWRSDEDQTRFKISGWGECYVDFTFTWDQDADEVTIDKKIDTGVTKDEHGTLYVGECKDVFSTYSDTPSYYEDGTIYFGTIYYCLSSTNFVSIIYGHGYETCTLHLGSQQSSPATKSASLTRIDSDCLRSQGLHLN